MRFSFWTYCRAPAKVYTCAHTVRRELEHQPPPRGQIASYGLAVLSLLPSRFGPSRAAWLRPKQTDLVPGKGQFRSRFHYPLQVLLSDNDFFWIRNRHRHHLSATLLDGRAGNGWARLSRCGRDRSGRRVSECWL
jgi:hypothetical protein